MSLKVYIFPEVQDYKKTGAADLLFGLQLAQTEWLLPIYGAFYASNSAISTIVLNKLDINGKFISSENLATDLIYYDVATNQYLIDKTKDVSFSENIFEVVFTNSDSVIFKTEPFLVNSDVTTPWILADGIWNNEGIWNNSKIWQTI